jgi:hypothetical protein
LDTKEIVSLAFSSLGFMRGLPEEERENKLIRLNSIIIRNIKNFITLYLIASESDMNIKSYQPLAFLEIISVKYKITLINNLIVVGHKYLESMCCCSYFPTQ